MTSLIRVFDADTIFLITIHAFLTFIPTQNFTHQISLAGANDSLKTGILYELEELSCLVLTVGVCTPCLLPFPTSHDETT